MAASPVISLDAISEKRPGDAVTIAGTAGWDEVLIKVVRPDNTMLYYDVAPVSEGNFAVHITLPADAEAGTYIVVAGKGNDVTTRNFVVKEAADSGTGYSFGSGISGSIGKRLGEDAATITIVKGTDGRDVRKVRLDPARLKQACALLADSPRDEQVVIVQVAGVESVANVEVPYSVCVDAALKAPDAVISIQFHDFTYELPLKLFKSGVLDELLGTPLGADLSQVKLHVGIGVMDSSLSTSLKGLVQQQGAQWIGEAVEFNLNIEMDGRLVPIHQYGKHFVVRTMHINQALDASRTTVIVFDPVKGTMSFAPAQFTVKDGQTHVAIKRNADSIYAIVQSSPSFHDIKGHWAQTDIELLAAKRIVNGITPMNYGPDHSITRAQFAAMLVRSLGITPKQGKVEFLDVRSSEWFAEVVGTAADAGIVNGYEDGSFRPNDSITREQMAVMMVRALDWIGNGNTATVSTDILARFADHAKIGSWAIPAMQRVVATGLLEGVTADTLAPNELATRAQAVVILKRWLQYVEFINR
ncbi:S-layer homology domain-containing protein [Paenibacillus marinisediminis]